MAGDAGRGTGSALVASPDYLAAARIRSPQKVAVRFLDQSLTFAELDELASALASSLLTAGLVPGDRFALLSPNHPVHLTAQLAACRTGTSLVPLNTRLAAPELSYIVSDSGARVLLAHEDVAALAGEVAASSPGLQVWDVHRHDPFVGDRAAGALPGAPVIDPEAVATILYTSGTTGRPKGAMISNRALNARMLAYILGSGLRRDGVYLQALPMFHIAATISFAAAYLGGTNVILEQFEVNGVAQAVEEHGVTHTCLVPTMIKDIVSRGDPSRFATLETVLYGASPIEADDLRRAMATLECEFVQSFGQTETGPVTFLLGDDHDPADPVRLTAAGKVALGHEVAVVDEHDQPVPVGEVGQIVARGPQMMSGYWQMPEATAETMANGWLHTGDLGRLDEDGYLYVTDRLKDMIISGGENVYPREVERVLIEHPRVRDVAVIGVPHERFVEAVHAVVVAEGDEPVDVDELAAHCRSQLAGYKVPKSWSFCDELPRNATGKVLKTVLRDRWAEGS